MGISPIYAVPKILFLLGLTKDDVDVFEVRFTNATKISMKNLFIFQINEAFASQFSYCVEALEVPIKKINPK
jgi:acetyl-CoA acetyltransferase